MTFKLVHVTWVDSENFNSWESLDALQAELDETHTVGLLVHETLTHLVVAHTYDPATESYNGAITIPRQCVERTRTIGRVKLGRV